MSRSPRHHPRQEVLKIEQQIFNENQESIMDSADVIDKDFDRYLARYHRAASSYQRAATMDEVEKEILASHVVLVGDYHTLDQSQRSFVRVLRKMPRIGDRAVVALETIQKRHQRHLDQYLLHQISEETFIRRIGFRKHWFFDLWDNYAVVFDYLKYHQVPVFGIETANYQKKTLAERDEFMAQEIGALRERYPDRIIFVLVGDLHLAPQHLPAEIERVAKKKKIKIKTISLFQNSPEIYFKLAQKDPVDQTLVVKLAKGRYCRMHTPPIIAQQSYLNWLYHEEGRFDWIDAKTSFVSLVERIARLLDLKIPNDVESVEVYTCGDLSFLQDLKRKKVYGRKELEFIRDQVLHSQSYFLALTRTVYIANVSIHHAAEEATHYLKYLYSGAEPARSPKDAFYINVIHEALGFFGSKLINSRRKCARRQDFAAEIKFLEHSGRHRQDRLMYETALLFLAHELSLKKGELYHTNRVNNFSRELFLSLSHAIGYDLGDRLYYAYMGQKIKKDAIRRLFENLFVEEGEPCEEFLRLWNKLKGVKRPKKI